MNNMMYNNGGQYYGGYSNGSQDPVRDTLNKLQSLVIAADDGSISTDDVLTGVNNLERQGRIRVVGRGTNRIAVEIVGDMSSYINFKSQCIIKVPYTTQKALEDNNRERILIEYLRRMYNQTGDNEIIELINLLPAICSLRDFPALIAQEKVIPIERSPFVKSQYGMVADECISVLLGEYKAQCTRINELMDKFTICSDINPIVTPFQYGFRLSNGRYYLTLLDTGYTLPKFTEMKQMLGNMMEDKKLLVIGRDIDATVINGKMELKSLRHDIPTSSLELIKVALKKSGLYFEDPIPANKPVTEVFENDMGYFTRIYNIARSYARNNPNSGMGQYFEILKLSKLAIYE